MSTQKKITNHNKIDTSRFQIVKKKKKKKKKKSMRLRLHPASQKRVKKPQKHSKTHKITHEILKNYLGCLLCNGLVPCR